MTASFILPVKGSDDDWRSLGKWMAILSDPVMSGEVNFTVAAGGDYPADLLLGDPTAPTFSLQWFGVLNALYDAFGGSRRDDGFVELPDNVRGFCELSGFDADALADRMTTLLWAQSNINVKRGAYYGAVSNGDEGLSR